MNYALLIIIFKSYKLTALGFIFQSNIVTKYIEISFLIFIFYFYYWTSLLLLE